MRIVGKSGQASIVEYERDGMVYRCLLPKTVVRQYGNQIPASILARGIEVGVEVEEAFNGIEFPDPKEVLNYVRDYGFWTADDVLGNPDRFKKKIADAFGDQIVRMLIRMRINA